MKHAFWKALWISIAGVASGCAIALAVPPHAADTDGPDFWRILDTRQVGAAPWIRSHPEWDGRGAVIAVLDTGVDMRARGLETTSAGQVKVIEARDFSGQGDVTLAPAEAETIDGVAYLVTDEVKVRGFEQLAHQPPEGGEWAVGLLLEERFKNSDLPDINSNGQTTDVFVVAVTEDAEGALLAYVDLDGDRNLAGAKPTRSYHVAQEVFTFTLRDPQAQRSPVTFALHIEEDGSQVSFHYDDGGHGTHVAGIAAGHRLMGRDGFDGIAPGAQILSLKIGDNTLAGGATVTDSMHRAIDFAAQWSKEHETPVIINLSYGIGSEIEGESDIDNALDLALEGHPMLSAAVSAGNEGPGLSSVGTPAASERATAVAAMLPRATAETLFGARIGGDRIFGFSSRGGELPKPDVLAPGIASSSVPAFDHGDVKGGTSMASPQIAGVYALLASAAVATKTRFTGSTMKRALLHSARPIPGYLPIEQGAGVPDVARAFAAMKALSTHREPFEVTGYSVRTEVPTSDSGMGRAAYWRTGTYLPPTREGHDFHVTASLPEGATAEDRAGFQSMVRFESDAPWLGVDRRTARMSGDNPLSVTVTYNPDKLRQPGVYSGRVLGVPDDGAGVAAFGLWSTVVVPHTFGRENGYAMDVTERLAPAVIKRYPILVPPGATHFDLRVGVPRGKWGSTIMYLFDPRGREHAFDEYLANSDRGRAAHARVAGGDLQPGIWEVVAYASFNNKQESHYDLSLRFRGLEAETIRDYEANPGEEPTGRFQITNRYDTRFSGAVSGALTGFRRTRVRRVEDDTLVQTYHMNGEVQRVDLVLRLDSRTYNRFTDVAVTVLDDAENALVKDGFVNGLLRLSIPKQEAETYHLQIKGAMTEYSDEPWEVTIEETYVWAQPIGVMVGHDVVLYPQVQQTLTFRLARTPPKPPQGFVDHGELQFLDRATGERWLTLPMALK